MGPGEESRMAAAIAVRRGARARSAVSARSLSVVYLKKG